MPNNKKIVILSAFYEPYMSGAEQMAKEIAERLGGEFDIKVITGRYDKNNKKTERRPNFNLIRVGVGHSKIDKFLFIVLAPFFVKKLKPDITHAIMESYAGLALMFLKYIYPKTKRILTLQSGDLDSKKKQKRLLQKIFWRKIHNSPDIITAISSALAKRAKDLGVNEKKIFITHNGIDLNTIPQDKEKIHHRVICVARLSWEKAHNLILEAWPDLVNIYPDASLVFVGEGKMRGAIEKQIEELAIKNSVILKGNLPHKEVLEELKKSEVFVCPSLAEGLGNVFIEAQACGVPPIGTKIGGIPDVIQHNKNGILINSENSQEIVAAVKKLFDDRLLYERIKNNTLNSVKRFDWNEIIIKIKNIYLNV